MTQTAVQYVTLGILVLLTVSVCLLGTFDKTIWRVTSAFFLFSLIGWMGYMAYK